MAALGQEASMRPSMMFFVFLALLEHSFPKVFRGDSFLGPWGQKLYTSEIKTAKRTQLEIKKKITV